MASLRTGKRYEIVFGPGINLTADGNDAAIDLTYAQVCERDSSAIILSASSDGLKVIGSDSEVATAAGRASCSIRCRVFDRTSDAEISSEEEQARLMPSQPALPLQKIGEFGSRNSSSPYAKRKASFKIRA
jgi:hypothetical protein